MREKQLYSMLIVPPDYVAEEINKRLGVVGRRVNLPHLTLGRSFNSTQRDIVSSLEKTLKSREPFEIRLDKVDQFCDRIIFLTTTDDEEVDKIKDLFFEIKPAIDGGLEERISFVPHLTLTKQELDESGRELLRDAFLDPICLPINRVSLFRSNNREWQKLGDFGLGKTS